MAVGDHQGQRHVVSDLITANTGERAFSRVAIAATLPLGAMTLLIQGILPLLLGTLEAEHRITASGIGIAASVEGLAIALVASLAGFCMQPRRLRAKAIAAIALLVVANAAVLWLNQQTAIILARLIAGVAEGVLFWIAVGLIARTTTTELWGALLNLGGTVGALAVAFAASTLLSQTYGVNGVFALTALLSAACLACVPWMPDRYEVLPSAHNPWGIPPLRGAVALLATVLFSGSTMGLFIYLLPFAQHVGLNTSVSAAAIHALLMGQIVGGALATLSAGRIGFWVALTASTAAFALSWALYAMHPSTVMFIVDSGVNGCVTFFAIPFLYPLAVEVDASRCTALQSGPAQLLGVAVGSFASACAVAQFGVNAVPYMSGILLAAAAALLLLLHSTSNTAIATVGS